MSEPKKFDAVVIGAGPGGYVCAIRLAQLGKRTAIVERGQVGGVCLNVGCIPSKALIHAASTFWKLKNEAPKIGITTGPVSCDLKAMQAWKNGVVKRLTQGVSQLLKRNGVEVITGNAVFKDPKTVEVTGESGQVQVTAENFVIATGSRVVQVPSLPFNGKNIIDSSQALELTGLPRKLVVIGGGFVGLEIGIVYAKLGSEVAIVEALDHILPAMDSDIVSVLERRIKKLGISVYAPATAVGLAESDPANSDPLHLEIETPAKERKTLEANVILVSVGRKANSDQLGLEKLDMELDSRGYIQTNLQGETNIPAIYAIGDVDGGPQLAHRASMDGLLVAATIAGEKMFRDYRVIPWAVFSDPEIAVCGLSERHAQKEGIEYRVGTFPFAASGKALSTNETDGFVKVLISKKDDSIIGVRMIGAQVSNLIAEAALAIEMGATAEDIVRTIHTHPTLPEAFFEAVEAAYSKAVHIYKPARSP